MIRDTGSPRADAESDFLRARRHQVMAGLGARLRAADASETAPLSLDEVVAALGRRGERSLGTLVIPLDRIVGSVDKVTSFDRSFRPTSGRSRTRWERIAQAVRRGETIPPIDVYKLGDVYFVSDGHHRVSVYRSLGLDLIEANVREIDTAVSADGIGDLADLDRRHWRRVFLERVPLAAEARARIEVTDPDDYHRLAERVEAWGARRMHALGSYLDKAETAERWYAEEFEPAVAMIDEVGARGVRETEVDAYIRVTGESYLRVRHHVLDEGVLHDLASGKKGKSGRSSSSAAKRKKKSTAKDAARAGKPKGATKA